MDLEKETLKGYLATSPVGLHSGKSQVDVTLDESTF
jgi:hypothetical protein